jgi:hypothetical protein
MGNVIIEVTPFWFLGVSKIRPSGGQKSGVKKVRVSGGLFGLFQTPFFGRFLARQSVRVQTDDPYKD